MNGDGEKDGEGSSKPKRVRTGCLTCRERHLKCDESLPHCNNCKKSNRECKRGIRLNFIDMWAEQPPRVVTLFGTDQWRVDFLDESRDIASEYQGGSQMYPPLKQDAPPPPLPVSQHDPTFLYDFSSATPTAPTMMQQSLPPIQGILPDPYMDVPQQPDMSAMYNQQLKVDHAPYPLIAPNSGSTSNSQYGSSAQASVTGHSSVTSYASGQSEQPDSERREYLDNQDETLFMQVFVEEVGSWMDSMDAQKHFSRLLPFHALSEPMLLNAFLACGARHLALVNPAYSEEKALHYYDTATRYLLKNLQNPNRDTVICATTAVILNVYEIMSEKALQRMNHIAGARALIKECGWNARAQGIGSACFWLNVGLEVLSCLHFNWQVAWDPDDWCLDMDFSREIANGREEVWTHRMLYIVAKVCNFRATIPRHKEADPRDQQIRTQHRFEAWSRIKAMADAWNDGIPRTMQPMSFLYPHQTSSKSAFPEVWLVKRTTVVARLFFHTAQLLLAQMHPYYASDTPEMSEAGKRHANMICGIVAHVKDRGVASVAIRSLAHAAEVLTDRREQEEVITIFEKINKETGWRIGFVYGELMSKWGWNEQPAPQQYAQTHKAARYPTSLDFSHHGSQQSTPLPPAPPQSIQPTPHQQQPPKKMPSGIPNPLYAKADFSLPQHPYMNSYVPPVSLGNPDGGGMFYNFS
ncbi:hypothetical protein BAUCODRAFT_79055 [Baudoinia panamericana UAMH 10762]|uniref:Zn(2)-C6 fungal-type domain-containing protein n=1 Tax=Baudoinia panamericana (strain UAMH 10762) TaxID=717646 RepID=M2MZ25_BAUPA|nr:uncharacterized protein BAUCODRAFT_79055 [Baudoinia panamericana UAMH 10762]EMC91934.1 hypothetical protein BAUCODRAFT_79055 [Baudoinia panamericana UAMH 10762]